MDRFYFAKSSSHQRYFNQSDLTMSRIMRGDNCQKYPAPVFPKINDLTLEQHLRRVRIYVDTYWGKQCNIIKAHCVKKDWNLYCVCITIKIIQFFMQLTFNWWWMLDNWHVGNISLVWLFWASFCFLADLILPQFSPVPCNFSQTPFNLKFK